MSGRGAQVADEYAEVSMSLFQGRDEQSMFDDGNSATR